MTGGETEEAELGDGGRTPEEDGGVGWLVGWWTCGFHSAAFTVRLSPSLMPHTSADSYRFPSSAFVQHFSMCT